MGGRCTVIAGFFMNKTAIRMMTAALAACLFCSGCQKRADVPDVDETQTHTPEPTPIVDNRGEPIPTDGLVPQPESTPVLAPVAQSVVVQLVPTPTPLSPVMLTPIPLDQMPTPTPAPTATPAPTEKPKPAAEPTATPKPNDGLVSNGSSTAYIGDSGAGGGIDLNIGTSTPAPVLQPTPVPTPAPTTIPTPEPPSAGAVFKGTGDLYVFSSTTLGGNSVDSKELFADASLTLVNIWTTSCSPCIGEMPSLGQLNKAFADKDFQVVGIVCDVTNNSSNDADLARDIITQADALYKHLIFDSSMRDTILKGVVTVPYTLFIDSEGRSVCDPVSGAKSYEAWKLKIEQLYAAAEAFSGT